jgi:hypothetical protein
VGEFSNNGSDETFSESCDFRPEASRDLRTTPDGRYSGRYYSTWQEQGVSTLADLTIKPKSRNSNLFTLTWQRTPECSFSGEGMLCDDVLIGDYRSV